MGTVNDDHLLPISALQHLLFCPRQCGLIHVERMWAENVLTVQGRQLHERAHAGRAERRPGVRVERGVPVRSERLGLFGVLDVLELPEGWQNAPPSPGGESAPRPVEYKRGSPKRHDADRVQLAAQAMCLEEMLGVVIPTAEIFYGETRRREPVPLTPDLRRLVEEAAGELHAMVAAGHTPPALREKKCDHCSLLDQCLPPRHRRLPASSFAAQQLQAVLAADGPAELPEEAS